jgi:hypothetical protein
MQIGFDGALQDCFNGRIHPLRDSINQSMHNDSHVLYRV